MADYYHRGFFSQGRIIGGLMIAIIGVLLLLNNIGIMDIGKFISDFWPILLILLGIRLMLRSAHRPIHVHQDIGARKIISNPPKTYYSNVFGDLDVTLKSLDGASGRITTVFGDADIDLTELKIDSGERVLQVSGVFGDIHVAIPNQVPYYLKASLIAGDLTFKDEKYSGFLLDKEFKSPDYEAAKDRLKIYISHVFGDIKIS